MVLPSAPFIRNGLPEVPFRNSRPPANRSAHGKVLD